MTLLRSLLFQLYFWTLSLVMTVGCTPLLLVGRHEDILRAMRVWARLSLGGLKLIVGTTYELRGRDHLPAGGALIAAKHLSMWETIAFHLILRDPALVMKRELLRVPLYGRYAQRTRMIVVDREAGAKALRTLLADAKARLDEGRQIVIFPEGTRVVPGAPPAYQPGVAALYGRLGVPCIPVALNSGRYWPRRGIIRQAGTIIIEFLEPIPPGLDRETFMARLSEVIETATARLLAS